MSTALTIPQRLRASFSGASTHRVLSLALPAVGEQTLNMAVGLADTFMVGHLGAAAVTAVGLSNQAVMLVTTFFAATATGVTALVARHVGAREPEQANIVTHQGYLLGILFGVLALAFGLSLSRPTMSALQAPAEVIEDGASYLSIVALSFPLAAWLFIGNAALRGSGDTRTPMLVMLVVNVVNIVVAYAAIYGSGPLPALGVAGSAIGAAVGRGMGGLLVTALLLHGHSGLRLYIRRLLPDLRQIRRIANIGLPAGAEQLLMRGAQTTFAATVATLGATAFAAHQIALQAESLSYMPGFGFAMAATTLVGQGLGAREPARARRWPAGAVAGGRHHGGHGRDLLSLPGADHRHFHHRSPGNPVGRLAAAAGGVFAARAGHLDGARRCTARRRRHAHDPVHHGRRAVAGAPAPGLAAHPPLRSRRRVDRHDRRSARAWHAGLAAFSRQSLDPAEDLT